MHTPEQLRAMSGSQFDELLEPLSPRDLRNLLIFMHGYSPEGVAEALNFDEQVELRRRERMAEAGRQSAPVTRIHAGTPRDAA